MPYIVFSSNNIYFLGTQGVFGGVNGKTSVEVARERSKACDYPRFDVERRVDRMLREGGV